MKETNQNKNMKGISIKDLILKNKGIWEVILPDKSKWVLNLNDNTFDNYKWYKECGTTESELTNIEQFMKGSWRKIK